MAAGPDGPTASRRASRLVGLGGGGGGPEGVGGGDSPEQKFYNDTFPRTAPSSKDGHADRGKHCIFTADRDFIQNMTLVYSHEQMKMPCSMLQNVVRYMMDAAFYAFLNVSVVNRGRFKIYVLHKEGAHFILYQHR